MGDAWNFFGIKAQGDEPFVVVRTREVVGGKDVFINAKFRRFASMKECFRAHGEFLRNNPRYAPAFQTNRCRELRPSDPRCRLRDRSPLQRRAHRDHQGEQPDAVRHGRAGRRGAARGRAEAAEGLPAAAAAAERAGRDGDPAGARQGRVRPGADRRRCSGRTRTPPCGATRRRRASPWTVSSARPLPARLGVSLKPPA